MGRNNWKAPPTNLLLRSWGLHQSSLSRCCGSFTLRKPVPKLWTLKQLVETFWPPRYDLDDANLEYWINLLSVSTRLRFSRIRARAVQTIDSKFESMCPVDKFSIGEMLNVEEWMFPSFSKVCQREKPLSDAEARKLDIVTVARIARAREAMYNISVPTPFPADTVMKEAFKGTLP